MSSRASIDRVVNDAVEKLEGFVDILDLAYDYVTAGVRGASTARRMLKRLKEERLLNKKQQVRDAVRRAVEGYVRSHPRYTTDELRRVAYNALVNALLDDLDAIAYSIALDIAKFRLDAGVLKGKLEQYTNPLIQPFIEALDKRLEEMGKAPPTAPPTAPAPAPTPAPVAPPSPAPPRPRRERKSLTERIIEALQSLMAPVDWHYVIPPPPDREDEWKEWVESEIRSLHDLPSCLYASLILPYFPWYTYVDMGLRYIPSGVFDYKNRARAFIEYCNITGGTKEAIIVQGYCQTLAPEYAPSCELDLPVLYYKDLNRLWIESASTFKNHVKAILGFNNAVESACRYTNQMLSLKGEQFDYEECLRKHKLPDEYFKELELALKSVDANLESYDASHMYALSEVEKIYSTRIMKLLLNRPFLESTKTNFFILTPLGALFSRPGTALVFLRSLGILVEVYKEYGDLNTPSAKLTLIELYPCEIYPYTSAAAKTTYYFAKWEGKCMFSTIREYAQRLYEV
ncbi:MAG: replication-relaxation family protein [Vulcanisaeta sp.]|nr:replication-relaxation family protein [Vulcanisaeta sp.]